MHLSLALFAFLVAQAAHASIQLDLIPDYSDKALPIESSQPNIPCDQIPQHLQKYNEMARQHDLSVANFLGEVVNKMNGWYDTLQPIENSQTPIPTDTFYPLKDGAEKISRVTDLAFENSSLLAGEMDRILSSLENCKLEVRRK